MVAGIETPRAVAAAKASGAERGRRRLEIVHESLLTKWPRLVRWRAQDEEGAVLRDQLRQAARLWEQHARAGDFLWTGTAFQEYQLWRTRYPGGLTALEEAFAGAMTSLAQRRRRRRRLAVAAVIALLASGLVVISGLRQLAVREARRAEASKVLALGQLELRGNPTVALAHATKSLELDDSIAARLFALKALAEDPPASLLWLPLTEETRRAMIRAPRARAAKPMATFGSLDSPEADQIHRLIFSPDGAWAALLGSEDLFVASRDDGQFVLMGEFPSGTGSISASFDLVAEHLFAAKDGLVRVWSVPAFEELETQTLGGSHTRLKATRAGVLASTRVREDPVEERIAVLAVGSAPRWLGTLDGAEAWDIDESGTLIAFARNKTLYVRSLADEKGAARGVGTYRGRPSVLFHPAGDSFAAYDEASGEIRLWSVKESAWTGPVRVITTDLKPTIDLAVASETHLTFDPAGRRLAVFGPTPKGPRVDLWGLDRPGDAAPTVIPTPFGGGLRGVYFTPDGRWLVTVNTDAVCFWPLAQSEPRVLLGHQDGVVDLEFTPDSGRVVSVDRGGNVREWNLRPGGTSRTLAQAGNGAALAMDREGRLLAVARRGGVLVVPLAGGESMALEGFASSTEVSTVAIDPDGQRVAAASHQGPKEDRGIRVWNLETGEVSTLRLITQAGEGSAARTVGLGFLDDRALVSSGEGGLRVWSLPSGAHEVVAASYAQSPLIVFGDGRSVAHTLGPRTLVGPVSVFLAITDLATQATRIVRSHGDQVMPIAVNSRGSIFVSGSLDGVVRVGRASGAEPHLLMGHEGRINTVAISPDGRWIASGGEDRTVRIWPMPDIAEEPLHTLPLDQLLRKLKSLTNVGVGADLSSAADVFQLTSRGNGYDLDTGRFQGWAEAPEW